MSYITTRNDYGPFYCPFSDDYCRRDCQLAEDVNPNATDLPPMWRCRISTVALHVERIADELTDIRRSMT